MMHTFTLLRTETASCLKDGAEPVLVTGNKVIKISNAAKVPENLYGVKVTVKGKLKGDTVAVASIGAAK